MQPTRRVVFGETILELMVKTVAVTVGKPQKSAKKVAKAESPPKKGKKDAADSPRASSPEKSPEKKKDGHKAGKKDGHKKKSKRPHHTDSDDTAAAAKQALEEAKQAEVRAGREAEAAFEMAELARLEAEEYSAELRRQREHIEGPAWAAVANRCSGSWIDEGIEQIVRASRREQPTGGKPAAAPAAAKQAGPGARATNTRPAPGLGAARPRGRAKVTNADGARVQRPVAESAWHKLAAHVADMAVHDGVVAYAAEHPDGHLSAEEERAKEEGVVGAISSSLLARWAQTKGDAKALRHDACLDKLRAVLLRVRRRRAENEAAKEEAAARRQQKTAGGAA